MPLLVTPGVSINRINNAHLADGMDDLNSITNSFIFGSTPASTCADSLVCHAMVSGDVFGANCNSVFGPTWRRVGVVFPQHTNVGKLCTSQIAGSGGAMDVCSPPSTPSVM